MYHYSTGDEYRKELLNVYCRLIRRYGYDTILAAMNSKAFVERIHKIAARRQGILYN